MSSRVGLLGGTFNPVHNGHLAIARQTRDALGLERVVLIPTGDPPHKPHEHLASAKDRYEMVRLAIASDPFLSISDVDVNIDITHTYDGDLDVFIVTRGARFFLVAALLRWYGPPIRVFIERYLGWVTTAFVLLIVGGILAARYVV